MRNNLDPDDSIQRFIEDMNRVFIIKHGENFLADWIADPAWTRNLSLAKRMTEVEAMKEQENLVVRKNYPGVKIVNMGKASDGN